MKTRRERYEAVVVGVSAGGLFALTRIFEQLSADFRLPVAVVQHRRYDDKNLLEELLQSKCRVRVKQADEKEALRGGVIYIAPPGYHLMIEAGLTFSLSVDPLVNFSRPSIDVLFETAAFAYGSALIGIILTGASNDGARGTVAIRQRGGLTIAQEPQSAQFPFMPQAAIQAGFIEKIMNLDDIAGFLNVIE